MMVIQRYSWCKLQQLCTTTMFVIFLSSFYFHLSCGLYLPFCSQAAMVELANYFQLAVDGLKNELMPSLLNAEFMLCLIDIARI